MIRGRKPTPDTINEARGNPGKRARKTISLEALPVAGIDAPKHMRAKGRKYWIEVAGWLAESRIVRVSDRNALARYCETLADYVKVTAALDKQGHVYTTESNHGTMQRISPWFMVQERLTKRLQDLEDRFGLAPASRQQILARMAAGTQTSLPLGGAQNNQDQNAGTGAQDAPVMSNDPLDFFNTQSTRH
ncbi:phage terminase small subunit P27 family [Komagataeibacter xylinus]|uniref:Phage terminase small subunit P27 family n=1 Tax=Komagataeibacter xylinus TaxID=28448 RepID=A0A857FSD7_KOMXY|nr:phage terminase small subunit P27 family [Komagataeibacter xylinus]QHC36449.1 phage terminase small subunit P27 family [Komagataeibacter xylinus]